jgi:hypothetical protein
VSHLRRVINWGNGIQSKDIEVKSLYGGSFVDGGDSGAMVFNAEKKVCKFLERLISLLPLFVSFGTPFEGLGSSGWCK